MKYEKKPNYEIKVLEYYDDYYYNYRIYMN